MNALLDRTVAVPLAAIFMMQTALTLGAYAFPVVIPVAAADLDLPAEAVGYLTATVYMVGMMAGLGAGRALARFGPTRVFQGLLAFAAAGAAVTALGASWAAFLGAALVGCATGPMNPMGSSVLARVAPAESRALIFSLKQCATPTGGMVAGVALPAAMLAFGWTGAMVAVALASALFILLAPFGGLGGRPERPAAGTTGGPGPLDALRFVVADPSVRAVTVAGFGLAVCQMGIAAYLVVFLWREAGFGLAEAGGIFAVLHASGIVARILLGLVADRVIPTRWVLTALGAALTVALVLLIRVTPDWPIAAVYGVVALAGASGNGWVGLYFAELARLAPADRVADVAAGSQFVTYLGLVSGPVAFGAVLGAVGSYAVCFGILAAVACAASIFLGAASLRVR